jgi:hypothetical protein
MVQGMPLPWQFQLQWFETPSLLNKENVVSDELLMNLKLAKEKERTPENRSLFWGAARQHNS